MKAIRISAIILAVFLYGGFWVFCMQDTKDRTVPITTIITDKNDAILGPIMSGNVYRQTFVCEKANLSGISIMFATYAEIKTGTLFVKIIEVDSGTVVHEEAINIETLADNAFRNIEFQMQRESNAKQYAIEITSDVTDLGNTITAWTTESNFPGMILSCNGKDYYNQNLCMKIISRLVPLDIFIAKFKSERTGIEENDFPLYESGLAYE